MSNPKISIITPVYNMQAHLQQCLDSVFAQNFTDFELICVNDGSKDDSLKILEAYKTKFKDRKFTIITKKNEGQGVARNEALKVATGDYVYFLDSDDWLEPFALERMYNKIKSDDADVVFFNAYRYDECEYKLFFEYYFNAPYYTRFKERVFSPIDAADVLFLTNALNFKIYKRSKMLECNFKYSTHRYIEDHLPYFNFLSNCDKISVLNEFLANYRLHEVSTTNNAAKRNVFDIFEIFYICEQAVANSKHCTALMQSFVDNRIANTLFYFSKTSGPARWKFYAEFRKILKYVRKKYGEEIINQSPFRLDANLVLKNKFYPGFWLRKSIIRAKIWAKLIEYERGKDV